MKPGRTIFWMVILVALVAVIALFWQPNETIIPQATPTTFDADRDCQEQCLEETTTTRRVECLENCGDYDAQDLTQSEMFI